MSTDAKDAPAAATTGRPPGALHHPLPPLLITMALWGSGFVVSKIVVEDIPHSVAAAVRFGSGALVLLLILPLLLPGRAGISRSEIRPLAIAGFLGVFVYNAVLFFGLSYAPAVDGAIIVPILSPILTTAAALLLRWEKAQWHRVAGLSAGAAGAVLFFLGVAEDGGGRDRLLGELAYVVAAVSWAAYTMIGKRILVQIEPVRATAYSMAFGSLVLAALAVPDVGDVAWSGLSGSFWWTMAFLVLGPTAIAYALFYRGVRQVGPTTASVLMFLVPVSGTVLSFVLLDESIGTGQLIGSLFMLVGAVLAVAGPKLLRRKAEAS
ncbi:DMT family transporter [Streptomyces xanthophaeus]|uniref:DMT family transporter n=1 Tax=Streptomyces xanthophaeus TaxID=67385 RepID=UPI00369E417E